MRERLKYIPSLFTGVLMTCAMLSLMVSATPRDASGQSLAEMYRTARFKAQSDQILDGYRAQVLAPQQVLYPTDSLRTWIELIFPTELESIDEEAPVLQINRWQLVPKLGRSWFQKKFSDVRWAYIGSNAMIELDTTFTRELRGRLEATFGTPTQTIADLDRSREKADADYVQFEYWFTLNDTIPLRVMDVNGPFERGLVVASGDTYRDILPELKQAFLGQIITSKEKAPYVDYYYLPEQQMWFLSGFDGRRFFLDRISKPDLKLGRPILDREGN